MGKWAIAKLSKPISLATVAFVVALSERAVAAPDTEAETGRLRMSCA
jgi:hypothetical protein